MNEYQEFLKNKVVIAEKFGIETDINDDDFDIETLLEPIEDECGRGDQWISESDFYTEKAKGNDDYEEHETYEDWHERNYTYPVIRWDGGHWGLIVNMVTGKIGD